DGSGEYRKLRDVLQPLGIRNQMVLAYDTSATYSVEDEVDVAPTRVGQFDTFGRLTTADVEALLDAVEQYLPRYPPLERIAKTYYMRGLRSRLLGGGAEPNPRCVALNSHMRLFPNGDVPTCQFNTKRVGNLRRQSFEEVWFGERIGAQRSWVRSCPGCWAECEVLPSAIYTGDLARHA